MPSAISGLNKHNMGPKNSFILKIDFLTPLKVSNVLLNLENFFHQNGKRIFWMFSWKYWNSGIKKSYQPLDRPNLKKIFCVRNFSVVKWLLWFYRCGFDPRCWVLFRHEEILQLSFWWLKMFKKREQDVIARFSPSILLRKLLFSGGIMLPSEGAGKNSYWTADYSPSTRLYFKWLKKHLVA